MVKLQSQKRIGRDNFRYDPSLVLYLPLRQLDGASFASRDAYGHLATVTGATWGLQGRTFDGSDDQIAVPDHDTLDIVDALTIEAWVKLTDVTDDRQIVAKNNVGNGTLDPYHFRVAATGKLAGRVGNGATTNDVNGNTAVNNGVWRHVVFTHNSTDLRLYVDGLSDATPVSRAITPITNTTTLRIGMWATVWNKFKGTIGEVRIYNRALTPLEIQQNYLSTKFRYQ